MAYFRYYKIGKALFYSCLLNILFALSFVLIGFPNLMDLTNISISFLFYFVIEFTLIQYIAVGRLTPFLYSRNSPIYPIGVASISLAIYFIFTVLFGYLFHNAEYTTYSGYMIFGLFGIIVGLGVFPLDILLLGKRKYRVIKRYVALKMGEDIYTILENLNSLDEVESSNCVEQSNLNGVNREVWVWKLDWKISKSYSAVNYLEPYILLTFENDKLISKTALLHI